MGISLMQEQVMQKASSIGDGKHKNMEKYILTKHENVRETPKDKSGNQLDFHHGVLHHGGGHHGGHGGRQTAHHGGRRSAGNKSLDDLHEVEEVTEVHSLSDDDYQ